MTHCVILFHTINKSQKYAHNRHNYFINIVPVDLEIEIAFARLITSQILAIESSRLCTAMIGRFWSRQETESL